MRHDLRDEPTRAARDPCVWRVDAGQGQSAWNAATAELGVVHERWRR
jgi:hypothetical protein